MLVNNILILSPHADDAEIGCGGLIARTIDNGGEVFVVLVTVSSVNFRHAGKVDAHTRMDEFNASMKFLGVTRVALLSTNLDGKLYTYPQCDFVTKLDDIQEDFKPDAVLIPLPSSHQDHRYSWEIGVAATRPSSAKHSPILVAAYEYPYTNWGDYANMKGGMYVDITDVWNTKVKALEKYHTQMKGKEHLISLHGIESLATMRGLESGFDKAELFHILRLKV